jgi:hypothetical protein
MDGCGQKKSGSSSSPSSSASAHGSSVVAVSACGPHDMVKIVKDECQKTSFFANWSMYEEEWEW